MKHDFIAAARRHLESLPDQGVETCILALLYHKGIGRDNAMTWGTIDSYIRSCGYQCSKNKFQNGLLKRSRESDFFIASTDKAPNPGYFLIADYEDAMVMEDWYEHRISVEKNRLEQLRRLL